MKGALISLYKLVKESHTTTLNKTTPLTHPLPSSAHVPIFPSHPPSSVLFPVGLGVATGHGGLLRDKERRRRRKVLRSLVGLPVAEKTLWTLDSPTPCPNRLEAVPNAASQGGP